ncbi:MAG: hypothetical protein CDV28_13811 [Candidatus Electronema aureum]|uniref:MobA/VirD2-like nuclease domain-containing protein n=1 Tax=Candidatus Electronema aureum TaxID=2005002 RepID=A0A521FZD5_9BACT|nr:MAG: hypothetical protein CDV28_13811 [Candidatus Electronema aureum]
MSRKEPSFAQLSNYIFKGADNKYTYTRNLYERDTESITREFEKNFKHLKRQKNSNAIYHEIISISKASIDTEKQKEKLLEIAGEYAEIRAKNCLVFGSLHEAGNNFHFHLMISSNGIEQNRNHYLSKKQFDEIKKGLERYVLEKYPELDQKRVMNQERKIEAVSQKEFELKKRTGEITKKESIQYRLTQIFNRSSTKEIFFTNLEKDKIQIYIRGNTVGFIDLSDDKQRKYRLKKLGLSEEFNKMSEVLAREVPHCQEPASKTFSRQEKQEQKKEEARPTKEQEALDELKKIRDSKIKIKKM